MASRQPLSITTSNEHGARCVAQMSSTAKTARAALGFTARCVACMCSQIATAGSDTSVPVTAAKPRAQRTWQRCPFPQPRSRMRLVREAAIRLLSSSTAIASRGSSPYQR
eukprot:Amastigsp_a860912_3.p2 type:complete len:110 gc:universal Amastigsp_a860912_3:388-59(-)